MGMNRQKGTMMKTKQLVHRLLIPALLVILLTASAQAGSLALALPQEAGVDHMYSIARDGERVYAISLRPNLFRFDPGDSALTPLAWTHNQEQQGNDSVLGICVIEGGVYLLQYQDPVLKLIYTEKQGLPATIAIPFARDVKGASRSSDIRHLEYDGQYLWFMMDIRGDDSYSLCRYDLKQDKVLNFPASRGMYDYALLANGQVFLSDNMFEKGKVFGRLRLLDLATGKITRQLDIDQRAEALVQDPEDGSLLYLSQSALWRWDGQGQPRQLRKMPVNGNGMSNPGIMLQGRHLSAYNTGLFLAALNPEQGGRLHLIGDFPGSSLHGGAYDNFMLAYPDVDLSFQHTPSQNESLSTGDLGQRIKTGMLPVDVMLLNTQLYDLASLIKKGFCLDLTDEPELLAAVQRMHPAIRDQVLVDGRLYGLPATVGGIRVMSWFQPHVEQLGIHPQDLPTSLEGLAEMAGDWRSWSKGQDIRPFEAKDAAQLLKDRFISLYMAHCYKEGLELVFSDPLFLGGLAQIDAARIPKFPDQPMLLSSGSGIFQEGSAAFSLQEGGPKVQPARMEVYIINALSENQELARQYLRLALSSQQPWLKASLYADWTQPVEQSDYQTWLDDIEKEEAQLKAAVDAEAKDSPAHRAAKERLEAHHAQVKAQAAYRRWRVSPEALYNYQQHIAPHMVFPPINPFTGYNEPGGEAIYNDIRRYLKGGISAKQLAEILDQKVRLMKMEEGQ